MKTITLATLKNWQSLLKKFREHCLSFYKLTLVLSLCLTACAATTTKLENLQNSYWYDSYDSTSQSVYTKIYEALSSQETAVDLSGYRLSSDEVFDIALQVSDDHPEFFYFLGDCDYSHNDYFVYYEATLTLKYGYTSEEISNYQVQLEAINQEYLSLIEGKTLTEILDITYDYLIANVTYNDETLETLPTTLEDPNTYSIIGAFIDHTCVCSGYAKAFQYLINLAGYDCLFIRGTLNDSSHAWNVIEIDGLYYHFDVTSDDNDDSTVPATFYSFYGLNYDQITQSHQIESFNEPNSEIYYNYAYLHGYYASDLSTIRSLIQSQSNSDMIIVQCSDSSLYQQAIAELIDQGQLFSIIHRRSYSYYANERIYTIYIF